ncbi:MAG: NAD-dependent protein deacylase, partial [Armatimonadetes bacterium]|nr:NAD-dependent protein deacylase [Armatimonadota bacterium]
MTFPDWLLDALRDARHVAVVTGAGASAESDVPTFRDSPGSIWAGFKPEEVATREAFRRNPKMVWEWYALRRELLQRVQPNPGHAALAALEQHCPRVSLITQNIDNLHQRAGSSAVIELHGNLLRTRCFDEDRLVETYQDDEVPPRCPRCGGLLRPDVVWFGEILPPAALAAASAAAATCDLFFSVGTSAVVYPAAGLALAALQRGVPVVEVNPVA